jgi:hydroxylamine dehydrogenase
MYQRRYHTVPRRLQQGSLRCLFALSMVGIIIFSLVGCQSAASTTTPSTSSTTPIVTALPLAYTNTAAGSYDVKQCITCHTSFTPGIVQQFESSVMYQKGNNCLNCHVVSADYPGAISHYGINILAAPTPAMCQKCHPTEVAQFDMSRHSLPAYVAVNGVQSLTAAEMSMYKAIPDVTVNPNQTEHPLAAMEGPSITGEACDACHKIGQPNPDGSVGECQTCHLTHEFSLTQVRKPETCAACHIGPDHPQSEIYMESNHGVLYKTDGNTWNFTGTALTTKDTPAPTCVTCHMSAFGSTTATHDVDERLTTFLYAETSTARPNAQANGQRMQGVCLQCHSSDLVTQYYANANQVVTTVNALMVQADAIMANLTAKGLITATPYDDPIKFVYFDLWHDYGRTAKFGAWMGGPDYTQWHGVYGILENLATLQQMANAKIAAGK